MDVKFVLAVALALISAMDTWAYSFKVGDLCYNSSARTKPDL